MAPVDTLIVLARDMILRKNYPGAVDTILGLTSHMPPSMKASMAPDLERGNRLELPGSAARSWSLAASLVCPHADAQLDLCDAQALHHGSAYLSNPAVTVD
jgi:hypothetical protein